MAHTPYSALARVYDELNDVPDYGKWAEFIKKTVEKYEKVPTSLVLDLGCGTGRMTFELHSLGYDMTGLDISPEMLSKARDAAEKKGINDILWLCADMTDFELYGTVDAAVCCLDGINHLTESGDLAKCLALVHNYLVPDGIFIFDINTKYKFENIYANNSYIMEDDGILLAWQNFYSPKTKICRFVTSVFTENKDGTYSREDDIISERCYSLPFIKKSLEKAGFEILSVTGDFGFTPPEDDDERLYIAARCIKEMPF